MPTPHRNTLDDPNATAHLLERLANLTPDHERQWGAMNAQQMLCHLSDAFRMVIGDRPANPVDTPFSRTIMKYFALHLPFPWPKGAPTTAEADQQKGGTPPTDFASDLATLQELLERFTAATPNRPAFDWGAHPLFGPLTPHEWARWGYRHMDHHLRQFGV